MIWIYVLFLLFGTNSANTQNSSNHLRQRFEIDYENNCFLKNGRPFKYYSGSIHYFRVPPEYWYYRLLDAKLAGLDAVQTYVEWSTIEPKKRQFNFKGKNNLFKFIEIAHELELLVILRPGPFIGAERDSGGFPAWLQWEKGIEYRTNNSVYMNAVTNYYDVLLPKLRPYLFESGGPIIMIQVENEYGSTSASSTPEGMSYKIFLRDLIRKHLGRNVVLFTTDGHYPGYVERGAIPDVYPTIDFGPGANISQAVADYRKVHPKGPLVNSEFYTGWFDHWSEKHNKVDYKQIIEALTEMDKYNFSVNFYMFHGGTNFGLRSGASDGSRFSVSPTSYDYDAPLSEAGFRTEKYYAIQSFIKQNHEVPAFENPSVIHNTTHQAWTKISISNVIIQLISTIFWNDSRKPNFSEHPLTFEDLHYSDGFVLYSSYLFGVSDTFVLQIAQVHDRALVYVNEQYVGKISRTLNQTELKISHSGTPNILQILVENQGRTHYNGFTDNKGILSDVLIDGKVQTGWTHELIYSSWEGRSEIAQSPNLARIQTGQKPSNVPALFIGTFKLPEVDPFFAQTFLSFKSGPWHKGIAMVNGHNIGRYWPHTGPQKTMYVPGVFLRPYPDRNDITLFELENISCPQNRCLVDFVSEHDIDSPVTPD